MKLYAKLMLSFGTLFAIALLSTLLIATINSTNALNAAIGENLKNICQSASKVIDEYLNGKLAQTKLISNARVLRDPDANLINFYLNNLKKSTKDFKAIFVVNTDGFIKAATEIDLIGKTLPNHSLIDYFQKAKAGKAGEIFFHDNFFNEKTQEMEIYLFTPFASFDDKKTIGVLIVSLTMDVINEQIRDLQSRTPGDKAVYLVNSDAKVLSSSDPNVKVAQIMPDAQNNSAIRTIITSQKDGYIEFTDHVGDKVLGGYADLKEQGVNNGGNWEIFTVTPKKLILAPIYVLQNILIITSIIILLVVLLLSYFIAKIITDPLKVVCFRINEIANSAGDLTQSVCVTTNDEIGDLAKSFNKMLAGIRNIISLVLKTGESVSVSSQQLSASAQQLSATTQEIASAVQQIAKASQNQALQVQDTSKVIEQMDQNVEQVIQGTKSSATTSIQATQVAGKGGEVMQNTMDKMNAIYETVSNSSQAIQLLGVSSGQIGEIVGVITDIADQTNLLALNAAIEAARAGDAGRGFAVVADEVRKLAEGSAKAADEISEIIQRIQTETIDAVKAMEVASKEVKAGREVAIQTRSSLEEIIMIVEKTASSIQQIADSAAQMSEGTKSVINGIGEVAAGAEQSAAGAEQVGTSTEEMSAAMQQIAAAAQALSDMAITLQNTVKKFKVNEESDGQIKDSNKYRISTNNELISHPHILNKPKKN